MINCFRFCFNFAFNFNVRRYSVENFICHNGDLEFFQVGGDWYDTSTVMVWLERATGVKMPSVAGADTRPIFGST